MRFGNGDGSSVGIYIAVAVILVVLGVIRLYIRRHLKRMDKRAREAAECSAGNTRVNQQQRSHFTSSTTVPGQLTRSAIILRESQNEASPPEFDIAVDMPSPLHSAASIDDQLPNYNEIIKSANHPV